MTARSRAWSCATCREPRCNTTRRRGPVRATRCTCLTDSYPKSSNRLAPIALVNRPGGHSPGGQRVPKREDIKKILLIGSGPIVIGQAAEFDYSGTQACRVLMHEGYEVVLVNS